jgi:hypothetical protein
MVAVEEMGAVVVGLARSFELLPSLRVVMVAVVGVVGQAVLPTTPTITRTVVMTMTALKKNAPSFRPQC